GPSSGFFGTR
uniref:Tachykinin-related peptide 3 n=1 Tax=Pyrrhocoris apterus TaxID=37000 RepID=TRP3_PYRAP|nr:RecName: Full=Tachykinin-related peptide 3; Short=TKRP-3 [Pyrrhocoris apterus]